MMKGDESLMREMVKERISCARDDERREGNRREITLRAYVIINI
jgi:hypothetical protein